ncbi:hypothetical protein [Pseudoclavibacter terrae]|uniref:hypothetical protein n=1 Tax=Pseudoclavibacter terrae TaxID=1530195 RepID=UPI00142F00B8|nr:hypothetical protein [Pseudoclavibacter terrae]
MPRYDHFEAARARAIGAGASSLVDPNDPHPMAGPPEFRDTQFGPRPGDEDARFGAFEEAVVLGEPADTPFGRMANLVDPFGAGCCLVEAQEGAGE